MQMTRLIWMIGALRKILMRKNMRRRRKQEKLKINFKSIISQFA